MAVATAEQYKQNSGLELGLETELEHDPNTTQEQNPIPDYSPPIRWKLRCAAVQTAWDSLMVQTILFCTSSVIAHAQ